MNLINSEKDEVNEMRDTFRNLNEPLPDINTSSNTNMTYPRMQKIFLVSSNPRTGSSYAANIITAMPNSSYYYEPFRITSHQSNNRQVNFEKYVIEVINSYQYIIIQFNFVS